MSGEARTVVHARAPGDDRPGHLRAVGRPIDGPAPGEVAVEVHAALLDPRTPPPTDDGTVVGRAAAGVVSAVGDAVAGLVVGDGVALPAVLPCRRCAVCQAGRGNLCPDVRWPGIDVDGWLVDRILVPAHQLVSRPASIPAPLAATVAGPAATALNAVKRAGAGPGLRVGVLGLDAVGLHLVQLASLAGAEVVAVDHREGARDRAEEVGADETATLDDASLTDALGGPVDRLLVTDEQRPTAEALAALHAGGRLVLVDLPASATASLPVGELVRRELDVVGATGLTLPDVVELFDLAAEGRLILTTALAGQHTVDRLADAEAALGDGDGRPIAVDPRVASV